MKRKMILFAALVAASSAALVSCSSSDDDVLAQAPAAPVAGETVVEESVVVGTPFSVAPSSGNTRAVRYGSSAWGDYVDGSTPYVNCFKLYGKQYDNSDANNIVDNTWMDHMIFTRADAANAPWTPNRNASGDVDPSDVAWPTSNTDVATNFYAITDNAIKGQGDNNSITGVNPWMDTEGAFTYTMQSTSVTIPWINTNIPGYLTSGITDTTDPDYMADPDITIVDPAEMRDLMYATTSMKESETSNGQLPLHFHHALSGLSVKAKFLSNADKGANGWATVEAVTICGLKTAGTFAMDPINKEIPVNQSNGGTGDWSAMTTYVNYHYELPEAKTFYAQDDMNQSIVDDPFTDVLVPVGEWLVIPQTTTPWDKSYNNGLLPAPADGAYIILRVDEYKNPGFKSFLLFPLNTTLNAGRTRVITVDIAQGREYYSDTAVTGVCDIHFEPSMASGSRQLEMDSEEF